MIDSLRQALSAASLDKYADAVIAELAVLQSSAAVVASRSQFLSFPPDLQQRLTLMPEGVDLERIKPDPNA